jgi:hypothetical protein
MSHWPPEGWHIGLPEKRGRYLVVDKHYWTERLLDFLPGQGWYESSRKVQAEFVAIYRPLPKLPTRPAEDLP